MSKYSSDFPQKRGLPLPLGATVMADGVNFAIASRYAESVELIIDIEEPDATTFQRHVIPLSPEHNKTGDIWHILLPLYWKTIRYGYRIDGVSDKRGRGTVFNSNNILIDPYSRMLVPRRWGETITYGKEPCCKIPIHNFDWENDKPLKIPLCETIIYELHVRGFTKDPSSEVEYPGTYRGIIEKIPYLKALGITAVELMPVAEFDEHDNVFENPDTGEKLLNFWGYSSINFFALKSGYAASPQNHINEFKEMVLSLHNAGIEVYLDIVFNHTGEGGYDGTTTSFRGIDNPIYYLLHPENREYMNFSGCGNTMNCNHPVVRDLIRTVLRYWVIEMHIDGFRFDLASILGRDKEGNVLLNPPMLEFIAEDPILRDTKIIAEAWDATGLYQVGSFSTDARWSEWNGKYRDDVRSFFAGFDNSVTNLATRIAGSSDLYSPNSRGPENSINMLTSHDGFTLFDLVSYEQKQNRLNGEDNRDGENHNLSWNSGHEGEDVPDEIRKFRLRRAKSMMLVLLLSQGVPMITAGDEIGRTQNGNNNAWCQDNETSWIDWNLAHTNIGFLRFFQKCTALRKKHRVFRRNRFFVEKNDGSNPEITWQALDPSTTDWSADCHHLAFLLNGTNVGDDTFFVILNGSRNEEKSFTLPDPLQSGANSSWYKIVDTSAPAPEDFVAKINAMVCKPLDRLTIAPMTAVVLQFSKA